ncbi:MAG TPA: hypothetical protein VKY31_02270 [Terriglobia bacterium]|nr:hypothetical protein [Terriglobia bacterium]
MLRTKLAVFASVFLFVCIVCNAQDTILKNADIVRMTKSGLHEDVILTLIKDSKTSFSTTPKDLADLRKAKVSEAVIQAMMSAVPAPPEPAKPAVDPGRIIKEGVGWGQFTIGANTIALKQTFGLPDDPSQNRIMTWRKLSINCLLDNRGEATELRFDKEFHGVTQAGIAWGMPQKAVKQAYGEPESVKRNPEGEKWEWRSKGILIWFHRGRVNEIVVFRPY